MALGRLVRPGLIFPEIPGSDGATVLAALAGKVAPLLPQLTHDQLYAKLMEREELGSTGIGAGVAIPHCKVAGLDETLLAVAISPEPVPFGAMDEKPVRVFFLVVSPESEPAVHLQTLAAISRWVKAEHHVTDILSRPTRESILALFRQEG